MNWKRILKGRISIRFPHWQKWSDGFVVDRKWSGRLIYISCSKLQILIDCRVNWIEDMTTGQPR